MGEGVPLSSGCFISCSQGARARETCIRMPSFPQLPAMRSRVQSNLLAPLCIHSLAFSNVCMRTCCRSIKRFCASVSNSARLISWRCHSITLPHKSKRQGTEGSPQNYPIRLIIDRRYAVVFTFTYQRVGQHQVIPQPNIDVSLYKGRAILLVCVLTILSGGRSTDMVLLLLDTGFFACWSRYPLVSP